MSDHETDPFIEEIAGELRRPVRFDSGFESRVMAALEPAVLPLPAERNESAPWLLRPRILYVSPLAGFAIAAGIMAVVTLSVLKTERMEQELASAPSAGESMAVPLVPVSDASDAVVPAVYTTPFIYVAPTATSVSVVGSFNDWDVAKHPLQLVQKDGVWTTNVPLPAGRYEYQFVVDGRWVADPAAPQSAESEFGESNSVLIVSGGAR